MSQNYQRPSAQLNNAAKPRIPMRATLAPAQDQPKQTLMPAALRDIPRVG